MSRYRLQWLPQGAIPADLNLKVTLPKEQVPGGTSTGTECVDRFAGYFVSGIPADPMLNMTWDWPAGSWTAVITGFSFICNPPATYTWTVTPNNFVFATVPTAVESLDPNGNPVLTVSGTNADELDGTSLPVLDIVLNINGTPVEQHVTLKPQQLNFYVDYAFSNDYSTGFTPYITDFGPITPDPSIGGQAGSWQSGFVESGILGAPPAVYSIAWVFQAFNAASTVTWNVLSNTIDTSGGVTVTLTPDVWGAGTYEVRFDFDSSTASFGGGQLQLSCTDDLTSVTAPRAGISYDLTFNA